MNSVKYGVWENNSIGKQISKQCTLQFHLFEAQSSQSVLKIGPADFSGRVKRVLKFLHWTVATELKVCGEGCLERMSDGTAGSPEWLSRRQSMPPVMWRGQDYAGDACLLLQQLHKMWKHQARGLSGGTRVGECGPYRWGKVRPHLCLTRVSREHPSKLTKNSQQADRCFN